MLESKDIIVNNLKINYIVGGKGEILLVLPGWPGNLETSDKLLLELSKNFKVIGLNWPGFGKSEGFKSRASLDNFINLLKDFLKELEIERVSILSFSFGATLAIEFVKTNSVFVAKMIAVSPVVKFSVFPLYVRVLLYCAPILLPFVNLCLSNKFLYDFLYHFVTRYDRNNIQSQEDKENNRRNLQNMNFNECLNSLSILKKINLFSDKKNITIKTLLLIGEKDSFVGTTSEQIIPMFSDIQVIKFPAEHYQILSSFPAKKIIHFFK
ncbi:alpha/beta hydrolase [Candidatus Microgenomates bacterium]|nr:alpha/beta hydrolase [Candidatus Microgenomates bacterium]